MKYIYAVKSGSLHPTANEYWMTSTFFSSLKKALEEHDAILEINRATKVEDQKTIHPKAVKRTFYFGEEEKYKAMIIIEKHELK